EIFHQTANTVGGHDSTGFNFGAIYDFNEHDHFVFSAGPTIRPAPTARDTRCPLTVFSTSTSVAIAAIQNTFITPPTNNNVINTQQHPTHRAPCQTPSFKAPKTLRLKPPWHRRKSGVSWQCARQISLNRDH